MVLNGKVWYRWSDIISTLTASLRGNNQGPGNPAFWSWMLLHIRIIIAIIIIIASEWTLLIVIHSKSLSSGKKQVGGINNFTLRIHRLIISIIVIVNNVIINIISINNTIDNISTSIVTKIITSLSSSIFLLVGHGHWPPQWKHDHHDGHPGEAVPQNCMP